jgi:glycosyltransferase involved in cell wall biosynthesis
MMEVSVVIPIFNRRAMAREAIESALAQRDAACELIVVDDGSSDGVAEEVDAIARASGAAIRLLRTANRGVAAARNAGAAIASSPLLAFLDSDDMWAANKLSRQIEFMRAHPACAISQTEEIWIRGGVRVNPGLRHRKRRGDIFIDSLRTCLISPSAAIMLTELFRELGGFDEDFRAAEDYDLWLRILARHEAELLAEPLAIRRAGHPGQLSATVPAIDRFRILALLKLLMTDLSQARREAVRDALAEKTAIFAGGLRRRGRERESRFILAVADAAGLENRAEIARAAAAMRDYLRNDERPIHDEHERAGR